MTNLVSIHSFRHGTGKSTVLANLAVLLALQGRRVALVDANLPAPSQHLLFDLSEIEQQPTLNDYLWGRCPIEQAAHDRTGWLELERPGRLWLVPASAEVDEISRILRATGTVERLVDGLQTLLEVLQLDLILVDTPAGVSEISLTALSSSQTLLVCLRPDRQDYPGTAVVVDLARQLGVTRIQLIFNEVPAAWDGEILRAQTERQYGCPVAAVLPHSEAWMTLASTGLFVLRFPDHPMVSQLKQVAAGLGP